MKKENLILIVMYSLIGFILSLHLVFADGPVLQTWNDDDGDGKVCQVYHPPTATEEALTEKAAKELDAYIVSQDEPLCAFSGTIDGCMRD